MEFENALELALRGKDVPAHWMGPCTPSQFVTAVEDVVWALTRPCPNYRDDPAPIDWLQTSAFPPRNRFRAHQDIKHWLAYSRIFLRRSLLAAAAAILCGPDVFRILNGGLRSSFYMSRTGLHNLWLDLPHGTKADLYCTTAGNDPKVLLIRIADHAIETMTSLKNLRLIDDPDTTQLAVAPDGSALFTRDIGTQEIYSLIVRWQ